VVNHEERVFTLLIESNPIPQVDDLDVDEVGGARYLAALEARSSQVTQLDTKQKDQEQKKTGRQRWLVAAVIIILAGVALIFINQSGETPVADQPFGPDSARDVTESFVEAHKAGDFDAVMVLFTADATFSDTHNPQSMRPDWEPRFAWDIAGEEVLLSHECVVTDEVPGVTVTVTCEYGSQGAVGVAADSIVDITATFTVSPDGISDLREDYVGSALDYLDIASPFNAWVARNFPEDADAAGCCQGRNETIEDSVIRGELRAQYAREWAIYLAENN
jgi:hypothetical protein